ncbi:MAG: hypothetical protein OEY01_13860 [Desulfobulbaceae bacterium]|nr:hypothetical protein [Desulfobulbaceae bacterium]
MTKTFIDRKSKEIRSGNTPKDEGNRPGTGGGAWHCKKSTGRNHRLQRTGQGNIFHVYPPELTERSAVLTEKAPEQTPGGNERSMVVDDEPDTAQMIKVMLKKTRLSSYLFYCRPRGTQGLHRLSRQV